MVNRLDASKEGVARHQQKVEHQHGRKHAIDTDAFPRTARLLGRDHDEPTMEPSGRSICGLLGLLDDPSNAWIGPFRTTRWASRRGMPSGNFCAQVAAGTDNVAIGPQALR